MRLEIPDKKFLEEYPLYRKFKGSIPNYLSDIKKVNLNMYCTICKSNQTFNMSNEFYNDYHPYLALQSFVPDLVVRIVYQCAHCHKFYRFFLLKIDHNGKFYEKVGQYPPWNISIEKEMQKFLGDYAENYKRGLISESQGCGIGAYAYYRRIVEDIIDELLDQIPDLMDGEEKGKYDEALQKTKETIVARDKISLVKDLLPPILRPEGFNPLQTLHTILSEGLHEKPEKECLEIAEKIRTILVFMVKAVIQSRKEKKEFTEKMKRLLEKKR